MLPTFVMLDLETTGGSPAADRIIEIAAVRVESGREVARWSTLVNPARSIPAFVQGLTGINDAMVAGAPAFGDVANELQRLLDGAVLAAHNVSFDHGFLRHEFRRVQTDLQVETLCTVRLSRKLYPHHRSHGLDAIMSRHGLRALARHRAMGDVDLVLDWLRIAREELGADTVRAKAFSLVNGVRGVPPHLRDAVGQIPDLPGVYLFYGERPEPLYVGRGVRLRSQVAAHFENKPASQRALRVLRETQRIEYRPTAGLLGAELLAGRLAKVLPQARRRRAAQADGEMHRLYNWPYDGAIGLREYCPATERTEIHLFDQWRYLATVHGEADLQDALESGRSALFDLAIYHLLLDRLMGNSYPNCRLVRFTRPRAVETC